MSTDKSVESVDCADTRLNKLVWIVACDRIDWSAVDVELHFRNNRCATVTRSAHTVKNSAQHIFADAELDAVSQESCLCGCHLDTLRRLEKLDEGFVAIDFKHLACTNFAVFLTDFNEFVVFDALNALDESERADDFSYGVILF